MSHRRRIHPRGAALAVAVLALAAPALAAQVSDENVATLEELAAGATPAVVLIDVETAASGRQGSGFLVDPSGRILTNYHVIRDARSARVKLASGDAYDEVRILAEDPRRDIAVLQIAGFDLPSLTLGNSDSVRVGSPVVLIGSPLGLENTVSTGIVSGQRQEPEGFRLLQVSAPASRGSSGGAVLNTRGEVVGIAVSQMEGGQNLNFAVPINYARGLLGHLGEEPIAVLQPPDDASGDRTETASIRLDDAVNRGLGYRLSDFAGYAIETRVELPGDRVRRTRTSYRVFETMGAPEPRIEQYRESETTRTTEPFGTVQTLRRERSRAVVALGELRPLSARGETALWNGSSWTTASHDLRFQENRAVGIVTDTTGRTVEVDRELPRGIVLHDVRHLAFAVLDVDSLAGRSVEFVTFDPRSGEVVHERYDVLGRASVDVGDTTYEALRLTLATGLDNETVFVRSTPPRVFLRRISDDGSEVESVTSLEIHGGGGPEPPNG